MDTQTCFGTRYTRAVTDQRRQYSLQGDFERAKSLLRQSIDIGERKLGPKFPHLVLRYKSLADVCRLEVQTED